MNETTYERDYGDSATVRDELIRAIDVNATVQSVTRIYTRLVVARLRNKVRAAMALGVDRRTIQRWSKDAVAS
jgi:hypothetical protein